MKKILFVFIAFLSSILIIQKADAVTGSSNVPLANYTIFNVDNTSFSITYSFSIQPITSEFTDRVSGTPVYVGLGTPTIASVTTSSSDVNHSTLQSGDSDLINLSSSEAYIKKTTAMNFSSVDFPHAGVYGYKILETTQSQTGLSLYGDPLYLFVYVVNDDTAQGGLSIESYYIGSSEYSASPSGLTDSYSKKMDGFVTTFKPISFRVAANIGGQLGKKDKRFAYTISLEKSAQSGADIADEYHLQVNSNRTLITIPTDGTPVEFSLSDGDYAEFTDMTENVAISLTFDNDGYDFTNTTVEAGAESTDTSHSSHYFFTGDGSISLTTNFTKDYIPSTGISLSSLPYLLAGMLALGLIAFLIIVNKKKKVK